MKIGIISNKVALGSEVDCITTGNSTHYPKQEIDSSREISQGSLSNYNTGVKGKQHNRF